jgi:hypothetical protein
MTNWYGILLGDLRFYRVFCRRKKRSALSLHEKTVIGIFINNIGYSIQKEYHLIAFQITQ